MRLFLILMILASFFLTSLVSPLRAENSHPEIFRYAVLILSEFIDSSKINPKKMFESGLREVELEAENFFFSIRDGVYVVHVENHSKEISLPLTDSPKNLMILILNLESVFEFIEKNYQGEKTLEELKVACINGMLSTLDPHSNAFTSKEWEEFNTQLEGEIYGVGMYLDVQNGSLYGSNPVPGGPAYRAGIRHGDEILQINDESAINITAEQAVSKIRGPKGSVVILTIRRKDEVTPRVFSIVRDRIQIKSVEGMLLPSKIGYVKVTTFAETTCQEFIQKIESFGPADSLEGLVIDLRYNGGGLLDQAILMSDYFIKAGTIVSISDGKEITQRYPAKDDQKEASYPICVLVNEHSASGAEVLAGALQKNDRAFLIGNHTFGKGSMQRPYPLSPIKNVDDEDFVYSGPTAKITIGEYLIPKDISIQNVGLTPDILTQEVSLKSEQTDLIADLPLLTEKEYQSSLISKFNAKEKPSFTLSYLRQDSTEEELEKTREAFFTGNFDFSKEEEVLIAEQLLLASPHPFDRVEFLENNAPQIRQIIQAHEKLILEKLKELSIDWTSGATPSNVELTTTVSWDIQAQTVKDIELQEVQVTLQVKNIGKEPVYRLKGISDSDFLRFKNGEFLFGKIAPGETLSRTLKINLPKFTQGSQRLLQIQLSDETKSFQKLEIPILLKDIPPPAFSFQAELFIEEKPVAFLQKGQSVTMKVLVTNIGKGVSSKGIASLTHEFEAAIFLEVGRVELKTLNPGEQQEVLFRFQVKELPPEAKNFKLTLYDLLSDAFLARSLNFPISKEKAWNTQAVYKSPQIELLVEPLSSPYLTSKEQIQLSGKVHGTALKSISVFHRYRPDPQKFFSQTKKVSFLRTQKKADFSFEKKLELKEGLNEIVVIATETDGTQSAQEYYLLKK